ncbi:MAG: hypothetical protein LBE55_01045 [Clostridiales bacterium]|jgi:hypothetical protein|nr:hypothetical protein [Clostridiales bacterium]
MGMTDVQFRAYIRLLIDKIEEAKAEPDGIAKDMKLQKLLDLLQAALED